MLEDHSPAPSPQGCALQSERFAIPNVSRGKISCSTLTTTLYQPRPLPGSGKESQVLRVIRFPISL